jgi:segregation and condensation protein B
MAIEEIGIIEAIIFSSDSALGLKDIQKAMPDMTSERLEGIVSELNGIYEETGRSFRIVKAANGYMFVSLEGFSPYLKAMLSPRRLSQAAFEVLAVIAYKGPCTKMIIDGVRGVDSTSTLKNLLKAELIDVRPGKPMKYITTDHFLEAFGLNSLKDLPDMSQFEEVFAETAGRMDEVQPEQLDLVQDDAAINSQEPADNPEDSDQAG